MVGDTKWQQTERLYSKSQKRKLRFLGYIMWTEILECLTLTGHIDCRTDVGSQRAAEQGVGALLDGEKLVRATPDRNLWTDMVAYILKGTGKKKKNKKQEKEQQRDLAFFTVFYTCTSEFCVNIIS